MQSTCQQGSSKLQQRVEFFRKLGYSSHEVKTALLKLGLDTDTNAVLGELVRTGTRDSPTAGQESDDGGSGVRQRGGGGSSKETNRDVRRSLAEDDADNDLKLIVIDGSNVAMR